MHAAAQIVAPPLGGCLAAEEMEGKGREGEKGEGKSLREKGEGRRENLKGEGEFEGRREKGEKEGKGGGVKKE